jgi:hypothetical protein
LYEIAGCWLPGFKFKNEIFWLPAIFNFYVYTVFTLWQFFWQFGCSEVAATYEQPGCQTVYTGNLVACNQIAAIWLPVYKRPNIKNQDSSKTF